MVLFLNLRMDEKWGVGWWIQRSTGNSFHILSYLVPKRILFLDRMMMMMTFILGTLLFGHPSSSEIQGNANRSRGEKGKAVREKTRGRSMISSHSLSHCQDPAIWISYLGAFIRITRRSSKKRSWWHRGRIHILQHPTFTGEPSSSILFPENAWWWPAV